MCIGPAPPNRGGGQRPQLAQRMQWRQRLQTEVAADDDLHVGVALCRRQAVQPYALAPRA
jgi:hypothetical protein